MEIKKHKLKLKKNVKIIIGLLVAIIVLLIFVNVYYSNRWYPNTNISGVDVSNMTFDESKEAIADKVEKYSLKIVGKDGLSVTVNGDDVGLAVEYEKNLEDDFEEHKSSRSFFGFLSNHDHNLEADASYNQEALNSIINNSNLITGTEGNPIVASTNAYITYDEDTKSGKIVEATTGNEINIDKLNELINKSFSNLTSKLDLSENNDAYKQPIANLDEDKLNEMLQTYNSYLLNWITWDMGKNTTETMAPSDIKNWLSTNDAGEVILDQDAMEEWIEDFCLKYKTVGKERSFTTHNGNVIQISGGDYGWRLDYDAIVEQVKKIITEETDQSLINNYIEDPSKENKKALTTELEPEYSNKGHKKDYENFENDWDTQNYSEIDLTEQRVYVYRNGQLAYSCICVSGLPTPEQDRITRTGVWYIKEKKPEKVLVGEDYETPVKYWIRIMWTGTGYHALDRSDWDKWTPDLYKTRGSHGCLNLQENDAKMLYELININDPVFIHY